MALLDEYNLSQDATFLRRVAMAAERKAVAISAETRAGLGSTARQKFARQVLADPLGQANGLAVALARDTTIAAKAADPLTITDAEITGALSDAVWNGYAEAFHA